MALAHDEAVRQPDEDSFGPGFISAASANDPTTVATLAVVGATTGYALAWLVISLLYCASVAAGIATPVTLVLLVQIARDIKMMGEYCIGPM